MSMYCTLPPSLTPDQGDSRYGDSFLQEGTIMMRLETKVIILSLPLRCKTSVSINIMVNYIRSAKNMEDTEGLNRRERTPGRVLLLFPW